MVPTFTRSSIGQGGAQLYSGSIATATPQAFTMASPPLELNGFGVDTPPGCRALQTGPYPPGWSRLRGYGASTTGSLALHLLTSLDEPAPSGSTDTARLLGAACHRSPSFTGDRLPRCFIRPLRRPNRDGLSPPLDTPGASWRTVRPRRKPMRSSKSHWPFAIRRSHAADVSAHRTLQS